MKQMGLLLPVAPNETPQGFDLRVEIGLCQISCPIFIWRLSTESSWSNCNACLTLWTGLCYAKDEQLSWKRGSFAKWANRRRGYQRVQCNSVCRVDKKECTYNTNKPHAPTERHPPLTRPPKLFKSLRTSLTPLLSPSKTLYKWSTFYIVKIVFKPNLTTLIKLYFLLLALPLYFTIREDNI